MRVVEVVVGMALLGAVGGIGSGCDEKAGSKPERAGAVLDSGTGTGPTATVAQAAAAPAKPEVAVDDGAAFVAGERIEFAAPDMPGRLAVALGRKKVEGETIVLNAARDAKLPRVATVVAALAAKKAKGVEVRTQQRDRSMAEVDLVLDAKPAGCSAVGYIAKNGAIATWPASGATAERFTRGMAGPDLTRGSEGIRKRVLGCDSPVWFAAADESVTWGLVFDLVLAVMRPEDAGRPLARSVALLATTPVPGRKVEP